MIDRKYLIPEFDESCWDDGELAYLEFESAGHCFRLINYGLGEVSAYIWSLWSHRNSDHTTLPFEDFSSYTEAISYLRKNHFV